MNKNLIDFMQTQSQYLLLLQRVKLLGNKSLVFNMLCEIQYCLHY